MSETRCDLGITEICRARKGAIPAFEDSFEERRDGGRMVTICRHCETEERRRARDTPSPHPPPGGRGGKPPAPLGGGLGREPRLLCGLAALALAVLLAGCAAQPPSWKPGTGPTSWDGKFERLNREMRCEGEGGRWVDDGRGTCLPSAR